MLRHRLTILLFAFAVLAVLLLSCVDYDVSGVSYDACATATAAVRMEAVRRATEEARP